MIVVPFFYDAIRNTFFEMFNKVPRNDLNFIANNINVSLESVSVLNKHSDIKI